MIFSDSGSITALREKCLNTELFLVRIFPHSAWTRRDTVSLRIQSECGRIRTRNNSVFGHFLRSVGNCSKLHSYCINENFSFKRNEKNPLGNFTHQIFKEKKNAIYLNFSISTCCYKTIGTEKSFNRKFIEIKIQNASRNKVLFMSHIHVTCFMMTGETKLELTADWD